MIDQKLLVINSSGRVKSCGAFGFLKWYAVWVAGCLSAMLIHAAWGDFVPECIDHVFERLKINKKSANDAGRIQRTRWENGASAQSSAAHKSNCRQCIYSVCVSVFFFGRRRRRWSRIQSRAAVRAVISTQLRTKWSRWSMLCSFFIFFEILVFVRRNRITRDVGGGSRISRFFSALWKSHGKSTLSCDI